MKKSRPTRPKVSPYPLWVHRLPVTSLALDKKNSYRAPQAHVMHRFFQNVHNSKRLQSLLKVPSLLPPTLVNDILLNFWLIVNTYRLHYLTVPPKRFDLNEHGGRSKNTSEYFSNGWLARRHLWCCCHGYTGKRLFHVGHSLLQVGTLMWMRTTMNYQYRHGTTTAVALRTLWKQGGVRRLYRGVGPALLQGPLARFGDTAANEFVLRYLEHSAGWQKLRGSTGGTRRKVWTRTKILSPNIRYFVTN